jgi:ferredoxin
LCVSFAYFFYYNYDQTTTTFTSTPPEKEQLMIPPLIVFLGMLFAEGVVGFSSRCIPTWTKRTTITTTPQWQSTSSSSSSSFLTARYAATSSNEEEDDTNEETSGSDSGIDVNSDERLYRVNLSRATGIEWGTDLSFAFVNVRALDPTGDAALSGMVNIGDQLCQLTPVVTDDNNQQPINLVGASFDYVMDAFANLDKSVTNVELVFFRGTKDELKAAAKGDTSTTTTDPETITVTVVENKDSPKQKIHTFTAPAGVNVRELCVNNGINVYQSITRWTNCKGKQLCGTCIVNVPQGGPNTNRKSMDEASTLRDNPDTYRLSCVTFAYGDVTIETFPPVNADQWTR